MGSGKLYPASSDWKREVRSEALLYTASSEVKGWELSWKLEVGSGELPYPA